MKKIVIIIFFVILLTPALDRKLHFLPVYKETEKRDLSPRPNYSLPLNLAKTMKDFESYWNDHFGGRSLMVNKRAQLWTKIFRDSPEKSVVIGQDGWLFYKSESKDDGPGINDIEGLVPLSEAEIGTVIGSINKVKDDLSAKGITLVVTVAPNKSTIYKEYLPFNFPIIANGNTRLDQLVKAMPEDINFVDLRSTLIDGKNTMPTYQKTDSHWNNYGAYLASMEIIKKLSNDYGMQPVPLDQYDIETKTVTGEGDLASMMAARNIFSEEYVGIKPKKSTVYTDYDYGYEKGLYSGHIWKQTNKKLPRLLMFGDSYRTTMTPFLIPYFSESYIMGFSKNYKINYELVNLSKPNVVIWEVAERYIDRFVQK